MSGTANLLSTQTSREAATLVLTCTGSAESDAFESLTATLAAVHADALQHPTQAVVTDVRGLALAAMLLKPKSESKSFLDPFYRWFNKVFDRFTGGYIGITGIVTLKERGELLRRLVPSIPQEQLDVETDAPYLTPYPERRRIRRNEPAFVRSVLLKLADVRCADPAELAQCVSDNTCRLYRIED